MLIADDKGKTIAEVTAADCNTPGVDEGIWLEMRADDGTRPTLCMVKDKPGGPFGGDWYLGIYRDTRSAGPCDLAVRFTRKDGPEIQVVKDDKVKIVNLFDLISQIEKLEQAANEVVP